MRQSSAQAAILECEALHSQTLINHTAILEYEGLQSQTLLDHTCWQAAASSGPSPNRPQFFSLGWSMLVTKRTHPQQSASALELIVWVSEGPQ